LLLETILSLVAKRERKTVTRARAAATSRAIRTMLHDAEPNFKMGGESPNITAATRPLRAALTQG